MAFMALSGMKRSNYGDEFESKKKVSQILVYYKDSVANFNSLELREAFLWK